MLSALSFLTVIGPARPPTRTAIRWFPLVGALVGGAVAAAHAGAHEVWPPLTAAAVVVLVDLVITGALHMDGLADAADGLLPHLERHRRLAVMDEPTVGAFAVITVVGVMLARWSTLTDPSLAAAALACVWALSRTAAAATVAVVPSARPEGLTGGFASGAAWWVGLWALPIGAVLVVVEGWRGVAALGALSAATAATLALAHRRLGGCTGDVLGAGIVLGETAALVALSVNR